MFVLGRVDLIICSSMQIVNTDCMQAADPSQHITLGRIKRTFVTVVAGKCLNLLRQILLVPLLISFWGVDYYSGWLVISSVPTFLSMSNLGLGTSSALAIAMHIAGGETNKARRVLEMALLMIGGLCVVSLGICFAIYSLFGEPIRSSLESPSLVVVLLLSSVFVRMLSQPICGWWIGLGKASAINNLMNLLSLGELLLSICIPILGGNATILSFWLLFWVVVWTVIIGVKTLRIIAVDGRPSFRDGLKWRLAGQLLQTGVGHQLSPLWQAILFQGSLILANALLGPASAALWGSLRIVARSGNQVLELITHTLGPEMQVALGQGANKRARDLHSAGMVTSLFIAAIMGLGVITVGPTFFAIWTRNSFQVEESLWILLAIGLLPCALWGNSGEIQRLNNQPWFLNLCALVAALIAVGTMVTLRKHQILGFAIGSLVFDTIVALLVVPRTLRLLSDTFSNSLMRGAALTIANARAVFWKYRLTTSQN